MADEAVRLEDGVLGHQFDKGNKFGDGPTMEAAWGALVGRGNTSGVIRLTGMARGGAEAKQGRR